jgi:hypothetical protein
MLAGLALVLTGLAGAAPAPGPGTVLARLGSPAPARQPRVTGRIGRPAAVTARSIISRLPVVSGQVSWHK